MAYNNEGEAMKFIKAVQAVPKDMIVIMGVPYQERTVKEVVKDDPLPCPEGETSSPGRYSIWFEDGSISDEVTFPQFLLVERKEKSNQTCKQERDELRKLMKDLEGWFTIDEDEDCSTQVLMNTAETAHHLRETLDAYYCLPTGCCTDPHLTK